VVATADGLRPFTAGYFEVAARPSAKYPVVKAESLEAAMAEMDDDLLIFTLPRLSISQREPIDNARNRAKHLYPREHLKHCKTLYLTNKYPETSENAKSPRFLLPDDKSSPTSVSEGLI